MSITKNPLIRYKILDTCFRNPYRRYFIEDLIKECNNVILEIAPGSKGISKRQVIADITFMASSEGWSIDLQKLRDGRRVFYRYQDINYSINNMPLNEVEIDQLQSAIHTLSQFNGMPQFEWMNELLPKLMHGIYAARNRKVVMSFDANQYLRGIHYIGQLYNAITFESVLKITYKDFKSEQPYLLIIHPYYLKQYNNRWFLFGFNPEKEKYDWNIAVDRIEKIEQKHLQYIRNDVIDWEEYFSDIIGVTKPFGKEVSNIVLLFNGVSCKYILNKPLHGSQRKEWIDEEHLQIKLELIINYELEQLIISFSDSVKVISPQSLVDSVKHKIGGMFDLYK